MLSLNLLVLHTLTCEILDRIASQLEEIQPYTTQWKRTQEGAAKSFFNIFQTGEWSNDWVKEWDSSNSVEVTHVTKTIQVNKLSELPSCVVIL